MKYTVENTIDVGKPVRVFLDGVEVENCSEADTDEGYVVRAKLNDMGELYVEDDAVATERLDGVVTVEHL